MADSEILAGDDFIIKVSRPQLTQPPTPPDPISAWLEPGWESVDGKVRVKDSIIEQDAEEQETELHFDDDVQRLELLFNWQEKRDDWVSTEKPARAAFKIFERLYELYGQIQRESERLELVLGDGILVWRRPEGGIKHPVLLQRLQLEFDPEIPEFTISESEYAVEIYTALFSAMSDVDGRKLGECQSELRSGTHHPLDTEMTSAFLRSLVQRLSAHGEFIEREQMHRETDHPQITRDPVIFLRTRTLGFSAALESILQDIEKREEFPHSLLNIVGLESAPVTDEAADPGSSVGAEDEDILLSKPANAEQLQIAQRLEKFGSVLVQGPPGTGKTHTIANLIGHLLAQGKSVLVTSHATKALSVLRSQVVPTLQALCVSVLERDTESRDQLRSSVDSIVSHLASDTHNLQREAAFLAKERSRLIFELRSARENLRKALGDEYRDVVVAGQAYSPSNAARLVSAGSNSDRWIPGPVKLGSPLLLSENEIAELYSTNLDLSWEDEAELKGRLPEPNELLSPSEFERLVNDENQLKKSDLRFREDLWTSRATELVIKCSSCGKNNRVRSDHTETAHCGKCKEPLNYDCELSGLSELQKADRIISLSNRMQAALEPLRDSAKWRVACIHAGKLGPDHRREWHSLILLIDRAASTAVAAREALIEHGPAFDSEKPLEDQIALLEEIIDHLKSGGTLGRWVLFRHSVWKEMIASSRVGSSSPRNLGHFEALLTLANLKEVRSKLITRWERTMTTLGGPSPSELGDSPEAACLQYSRLISSALDWHEQIWTPLEQELEQVGFRWNTLLDEVPPNLTREEGELLRISEAFERVPATFDACASRFNLLHIEKTLQRLSDLLRIYGSDARSSEVINCLQAAVEERDPVAYREAVARLIDLGNRRATLKRREELLNRMEFAAQAWASAIRKRVSPHNDSKPPGSAQDAWLWRQLNDELCARGKISIDDLQKDLERLSDELRQITAELVDRRAWIAQVSRTSLKERLSLVGWLKIINKIGKGTGKRAPRLQAEARKLMQDSRTAVPVWIAPLSRVVENFDPAKSHFDVIIIDEASQSDVMGLIALYLGKQVIVVGDDQQVSPDAVGQKLDVVQHLIDQHLQGIPNDQLYDGQYSIYDLAMTAFAGTICLREHFRCVPDIIRFSNHLSYNGQIKPLREESGVITKPYVCQYRVEGASSANKINETEAYAVASLLVAAIEQPEYEGKTFGVISLVGTEQADLIRRVLQMHLEPVEFERRRITCGNAAQFQGDERDIMFLSVVDAPQQGPLALREEPRFKRRFNVAASRARDQMWVVHSLQPDIDLKPGDLRRRLIEHARDPKALARMFEEVESKTESEFERLVARLLVSAGYDLTPQLWVGHYRIDLVVNGGGKRLAVECDGDRFHPPDKIIEDMMRQAILERLGWRFVRIRGSEFFRNPEQAIEKVFERLRTLGIEPEAPRQNEPLPTPPSSELQERVIRKAAELLAEWRPSEPSERSESGIRRGSDETGDAPREPPSSLSTRSEVPVQPTVKYHRTIDDVTRAELQAAIHQSIPESGSVDRDEFLRVVTSTIGFSKLGKRIRSRINKALNAEVRAGRLKTDWKQISRVG